MKYVDLAIIGEISSGSIYSSIINFTNVLSLAYNAIAIFCLFETSIVYSPFRVNCDMSFTRSSSRMSSASSQFVSPRNMVIYEPNHQISMWENSLNADNSQNTASSSMVETNVKLDSRVRDVKSVYLVATLLVDLLDFILALQLEDAPNTTVQPSKKYNQEASKPADKVANLSYHIYPHNIKKLIPLVW